MVNAMNTNGSTLMTAAANAANRIDNWSEAKRDFAERASACNWRGSNSHKDSTEIPRSFSQQPKAFDD
jgi:hypothetical protein